MSNLLVIVQKVDENDDHRGSLIGWLKEFAKRFDKISVITLSEGSHTLAKNIKIYSLGKDRGAPKLLQAIRFYWYLIRLLPRSKGVFAHASAIFVLASWPMTWLFHKRIVLWYLHRSVDWRLRLAEKMAFKIATANRESLGIKSDKVIEVGHGIDLDFFKTDRNWSRSLVEIISVGRISPIKGLETLIQAIKLVSESNGDINTRIIGQPVMPGDYLYLSKLKKLTLDLEIDKFVKFNGASLYKDMPGIYRDADISVNLAPRGGIDKTVLESMASGLLVLTSNEVFAKYFGEYSGKLIFRQDDPIDLAKKIEHLISLSLEDKQKISRFLVGSVREHHLLQDTIGRLSDLIKLK